LQGRTLSSITSEWSSTVYKHGQQEQEGDAGALLCSGETSLGVLPPDVGSSVQERRGPVGVCSEVGQKKKMV